MALKGSKVWKPIENESCFISNCSLQLRFLLSWDGGGAGWLWHKAIKTETVTHWPFIIEKLVLWEHTLSDDIFFTCLGSLMNELPITHSVDIVFRKPFVTMQDNFSEGQSKCLATPK